MSLGTCFYSSFGGLGRGYIKGTPYCSDDRSSIQDQFQNYPLQSNASIHIISIISKCPSKTVCLHPIPTFINIPTPTHPTVYRSNLTIPSLPHRRRTPRRPRRHPRQDCRRRDQHPRRHSRWTGQHSRRRDLRSGKHCLGCY